MKGGLHNIDNLFKAGLEGKEEMPSENVWNSIDQDLDKSTAISIRKKYARLRQVSAVLLILLLGISIYALRNNLINRSNTTSGNQKTETSLTTKNNPASINPKPGINENRISTGVSEKNKDNVQISTEVSPSADPEIITGTVSKKSPVSSSADPEIITGTVSNKSPVSSSAVNKSAIHPTVNTSMDKADNLHAAENNLNAAESKLTPVEKNTAREMATPEIAVTPRNMPPAQPVKITSANPFTTLTNTNSGKSEHSASIPVMNKRISKPLVPKFSITPMASMNFISNKIENDPDFPGSMGDEKYEIEKTENEKLSFSAGILADIRITSRITLQSGIGFTQKTTTINPKGIGAVKDMNGKIRYRFDCSAGTYFIKPKYGTYPAVGDSAYTIYSENKLEYINIPLVIKFHFGNSKFNFYPMAGASANILVGQNLHTGLQNTTYYSKTPQPNAIGLNKFYISGILGAGVDIALNKRLALSFLPNYHCALNPVNKDMPFKAYPRSFSIAGGIRISL